MTVSILSGTQLPSGGSGWWYSDPGDIILAELFGVRAPVSTTTDIRYYNAATNRWLSYRGGFSATPPP